MKGGLEPLSGARRELAEDRLRKAWPLLVGPALLRHTRIIRLKGNTLLLGCFELSLIPGLRQAAQGAWPELKERIRRSTRLDLASIEVIPCDPPLPVPLPRTPEDPLAEVLRWYRAHS